MNKSIKFFPGLLIALFLFFYGQIYSQNTFDEISFMNLGIGYGSNYYPYTTTICPPIHASYEYLFMDNVGMGGLIGYTSSQSVYRYNGLNLNGINSKYHFGWRHDYFQFGIIGAYHFFNNKHFDFYGGLMLGSIHETQKFATKDDITQALTKSNPDIVMEGVHWSILAGGRYMFSDKYGIFIEGGTSFSYARIGVTRKFN